MFMHFFELQVRIKPGLFSTLFDFKHNSNSTSIKGINLVTCDLGIVSASVTQAGTEEVDQSPPEVLSADAVQSEVYPVVSVKEQVEVVLYQDQFLLRFRRQGVL
jgi:hypothetical protein